MAFFTNQAQLRYGNEVANSNITVGEIQEVLSVTKSAVKQTYRQHDTVTYIINIVNAGTAEYTGLTMTDDLGRYAFWRRNAYAAGLCCGDHSLLPERCAPDSSNCGSRTTACDYRDQCAGRRKCDDHL
ncbi:MAG: hypothetical protein ACLUD2_05520 [Clostridium sp.]